MLLFHVVDIVGDGIHVKLSLFVRDCHRSLLGCFNIFEEAVGLGGLTITCTVCISFIVAMITFGARANNICDFLRRLLQLEWLVADVKSLSRRLTSVL